jgi:tRNA(fMet)-specific endonuclease VapC
VSDLRLMVDTNIASHFMRFPEGVVAQRLRDQSVGSVGISIIAVSELRFGVSRVQSARLHDQVEWVLARMTVLPLAAPVDLIYADLRAYLAGIGKPIGPNDLFIAAHALAHDVPLATANIGEFSRVPNLRVENWLD